MANEQNLSRAQRKRLAQQRSDIRAVLTHGPSKRLLGTIFDLCGLYRAAGAKPDELLLQAGRRNVGLDLMALLNDTDPYAFTAIQAEAIKARLAADAEMKQEQEHHDDL